MLLPGMISQDLFILPSLKNAKLKKKEELSHPSTIKLIYFLSSKKADIAEVIDFILHVVYNRPKREKSPGENRYTMLKGKKKKKFVETKLLPPGEQSLHMKTLIANFHMVGQIA